MRLLKNFRKSFYIGELWGSHWIGINAFLKPGLTSKPKQDLPVPEGTKKFQSLLYTW